MDEMMNRMIEQMGKLTEALVLMREQIEALKITVNVVEDKAPGVETTPEPEPEALTEKKIKPKKSDPKPKAPAAPVEVEPEQTTAPVMPLCSDDVRAAVKEVMDKKGTGVAKEIINGIGNAPNVSAIPAEKYEAVIKACKETIK